MAKTEKTSRTPRRGANGLTKWPRMRMSAKSTAGTRQILQNQGTTRFPIVFFKPRIDTNLHESRMGHECKFVFLGAAQVERGAVVHTSVDVRLQEAWAKTPTGKKRERTHIVRCETEIFRVAGIVLVTRRVALGRPNFQPSLRDSSRFHSGPGVATPGYCQMSLTGQVAGNFAALRLDWRRS
jgi:hypothetical protein